jgi:SgrR family transcriptional regulator
VDSSFRLFPCHEGVITQVLQTAIHFFVLRKALSNAVYGEPISVTTEQLSHILFCTPRNVKLILNKLIQLEWVQFAPGRGRGNRSELTFLANLEETLFSYAKELVEQGELKEAVELIRQYGEGTRVGTRITESIGGYFGYHNRDRGPNHEEAAVEVLRIPIFRPITTVDPVQVFYDLDAHVVKQVYDTLVRYHPRTQQVEGLLAHHWESNHDCTKWVFYLRKGILFHNGHEFTSDDVLRSLGRLNQSSHRWLVQDVKEIFALDRYTVQMDMESPNYLFLRYLSFTPASIVLASASDGKSGQCDVPPFGTGPFKLVRHSSNGCVLEAFPAYFQGRAHLDRVEITRVPVDIQLWRPTNPSLERIYVDYGESDTYANATWQGHQEVYAGSNVLTMNLTKQGPQNHVDFRKALHLLLDRAQMVEDLGEPRIQPAAGFQLREEHPSRLGSLYPVQAEANIGDEGGGPVDGVDVEAQVIPLLTAAGYVGETLHLYTYDRHLPDAEWIKKQCTRYGIVVEVHGISWQDMRQLEHIQTADCILFEADFLEGQVQQIELYQYTNSFVRMHLREATRTRVDEKVRVLLQEADEMQRDRILLDIEGCLKEDYAVLFLVHKRLGTTFHPSVKGLRLDSRGWIDLRHIWFQSEAAKSATSDGGG